MEDLFNKNIHEVLNKKYVGRVVKLNVDGFQSKFVVTEIAYGAYDLIQLITGESITSLILLSDILKARFDLCTQVVSSILTILHDKKEGILNGIAIPMDSSSINQLCIQELREEVQSLLNMDCIIEIHAQCKDAFGKLVIKGLPNEE